MTKLRIIKYHKNERQRQLYFGGSQKVMRSAELYRPSAAFMSLYGHARHKPLIQSFSQENRVESVHALI